LAFFERQYVLLNQKQLMMEAQHHYVSQLIKQLYVLVLGLDVLGNPFGLVSGFKQGVEDLFYEAFQVYMTYSTCILFYNLIEENCIYKRT